MTTLAADTWGIPGPTFAALYPVLLVVVAVAVFVGRRYVGAGAAPPGPSLTPIEVAYLRGGPALAVATSLGQLRAEGALDAQAQAVRVPMSKDPLDLAVFHAVREAGTTRSARRITALTGRSRVQKPLTALGRRLEVRGLLRTETQVRAVRLCSLALWAIVAVGAARVVAGAANHKPTGLLVLELMVAAVVAGVASVTLPDGPSGAARAAIGEARKANTHLDPTLQPSWTTYGAAGAGMSIALFGAPALLLAQPAFADTVAVGQLAAAGPGGTGSGGGAGDSGGWGGGSSCSGGGSSCGGGCGGGCGG